MVIKKTISTLPNLPRADFAKTVELTNSEMKTFATTFLDRWKIECRVLNTFFVGGFMDKNYFYRPQYPTSEEGQYLLLLTARKLIEQVLFHLKDPKILFVMKGVCSFHLT